MRDLVMVFKALSDERRIEILKMLKNEEKCACVLQDKMDLSQSGLSYHLKILTEAGLIIARPQGKWIHYSIQTKGFGEISNFLKDF